MDKSALPYWSRLKTLIAHRAVPRTDEVTLAGGDSTASYLDLKGLFTNGHKMIRLADCVLEYCDAMALRYSAVGGPTMGADFLSHAIACRHTVMIDWFSVRDAPKDHGLQRLIEGVRLDEGHRVILVDDVVSTGNSLLKACEVVRSTGAQVAAVMPIVDRSGHAWKKFFFEGIPYRPLFTHEELGIDPL